MIFNLRFINILSNKCVMTKFLHFTWDLKAAEQTACVMRANRNAERGGVCAEHEVVT